MNALVDANVDLPLFHLWDDCGRVSKVVVVAAAELRANEKRL